MKIKHLIILLLLITISIADVNAQTSSGTPKKIALVGDLQKTTTLEFLMAREENDAEREKIVKSISFEKPDLLVLLGDMVSDGSDPGEWKGFSLLIKPLRGLKIPIYPVLGNHEYWGPNVRALRLVSEQFPVLKDKHWYSVTYDSLGLIFLDSNNSEYTLSEWDTQRLWFENKIKEFDKDPAILGVFVFLHHPPYTNSTVVGDAIQVQLAFVPAFKAARKTIAMFSGHSHAFEKFFIDNKYFIVSGGGGGPRVKLKEGPQYHHDLCTLPSPRPFNYVTLQRENHAIKFTVKGLEKGGTRIFIIDSFLVNFNL